MLFLLDANVLINAKRDYYPITRVPEFWAWLVHQGTEGRVKIPREMYEEITVGNDDLAVWAKQPDTKHGLLLEEEPEVTLVRRVIVDGYAPDLNDEEIQRIGRDPFLIAVALAAPGDRCVVTTEGTKPSTRRANRRVPDVCRDLGIPCCDTFKFVRELDFKTGWRSG